MRLLLSLAFLLLAGCGPTMDNALILAARRGDVDEVRRLAASGDPNVRGGVNNWTALMHAVHKNQVGSAVALLESGAHPNAGKSGGGTALMMAAGYGNTAMVKALLAGGANPRLETRGGESALVMALGGSADIDRFTVGKCQTETVAALLAHIPDLAIPNGMWGRLVSPRDAINRADASTISGMRFHRRTVLAATI
ncbi:MAG: ankyrin repeat domain-containing protein, partial [Bryobacteraceae bacterium]